MIEIKNDRGFVFFKDGILTLLKYDYRNLSFELIPISDYEELYKTMPITDTEIVDVDTFEATGMCHLKSLSSVAFYDNIKNIEAPAQDALLYCLENDLPVLVMTLYDQDNIHIKIPLIGMSLIDILLESELCASKGDAKKCISAGGIYVNNIRENNIEKRITIDDLLYGKYILLRKGKINYKIIHFI